MLNELSALRKIEEHFSNSSHNGVVVGIGDDTAAINIEPDTVLLTTVDTQVEGVHFKRGFITPEQLARKSVAVSVSDIAAMGGVPKYILSTVGFTELVDEAYLDRLLKGYSTAESEFGVRLVGGNLSKSPCLFIDVTVLGEIEPQHIVKRLGAKTGDEIYASGTLGDSALGLRMLLENGERDEYLVERYTKPNPRVELGHMLATRHIPTAMIDLSDGLLLDLERLTVNNGLGAEINLNSIPLSPEYKTHIDKYSDTTYGPAISGGEDYELLFAAPSDRSRDIEAISADLGIGITHIGHVTDGNELSVLDLSGNKIDTDIKGYVHATG